MTLAFDDLVRLLTNVAVLILAIMAMFYCFAMWLDRRRAYLLFGALTLLGIVPYVLLRIAVLPKPPLLPMDFINTASLVINGFWTVCGLAWLVSLLQWQRKVNHIAHKYLDRNEGGNS